MRISDWSSDVCSSDLLGLGAFYCRRRFNSQKRSLLASNMIQWQHCFCAPISQSLASDRKSVVEGKSVSVRVDLGGRRIIKKKNKHTRKEEVEETETTKSVVTRTHNIQISDYRK